jgi:YD repeat-containing protein
MSRVNGAGNIKTIGTSGYTYDKVSRLVAATLYDGPTGGGTQKQQSYTFDPFGNLTNITGTSGGRATPTSAQTNRLNGAGTVYDAAGKPPRGCKGVFPCPERT